MGTTAQKLDYLSQTKEQLRANLTAKGITVSSSITFRNMVNLVNQLPALNISGTFANNDWATIVYLCKLGAVPSSWAAGNSKTMKINGVNYQVDIIGKNHDDYSDGSGKAPLTFQLHDCYNTKYQMNSSNTNSGGWTSCAMRSTSLPAILALMPSEVRAGIKEVNKLTSAGSQSSTINTTNDKLFLLSEVEIEGNPNYSVAGEGSQYEYYRNGGSKIKKVNGADSQWWTRSPVKTNSGTFCNTGATGNVAWGTSATSALGVSPAFCF